jgi:hypothetical protein
MDLSWTFQTEDAIVAAPVIGDNSIFVSSIDGLFMRWIFRQNDLEFRG